MTLDTIAADRDCLGDAALRQEVETIEACLRLIVRYPDLLKTGRAQAM